MNQTTTAFLSGRPAAWYEVLKARYCLAVAVTYSDPVSGKTVRLPSTGEGSAAKVWEADGTPVPGVAIDILLWTRFVDETGKSYVPLGGTWYEASSITGAGLAKTMGPDDIRPDMKKTMRLDRLRLVAAGIGCVKAFVPESSQKLPMPKWAVLLGLEKNIALGWTAGEHDILPYVRSESAEDPTRHDTVSAVPFVTNRAEARDVMGDEELRVRQADHIPSKELLLYWTAGKVTQKVLDNPTAPAVFQIEDPAVLDGLLKARCRDVITSVLEGGNGAPASTYVDAAFGE